MPADPGAAAEAPVGIRVLGGSAACDDCRKGERGEGKFPSHRIGPLDLLSEQLPGMRPAALSFQSIAAGRRSRVAGEWARTPAVAGWAGPRRKVRCRKPAPR